MTTSKKSANDFVSDFISGDFRNLAVGDSAEMFKQFQDRVEQDYAFTPEDLKLALTNSRDQLEAALGVPLTDEQLNALAGGKSQGAKDAGLYAGGGIAGAVGGGIALAVFWTIVK